MLGIFLGALNGYLIVGSIWYFLAQANYQAISYIIPPDPTTSAGSGSNQAARLDGTSLAGSAVYLFCDRIVVHFCDRGLFMTDGKSVHFIGIGGTGLSAIARVLLESGYLVTGSDRAIVSAGKKPAGRRCAG